MCVIFITALTQNHSGINTSELSKSKQTREHQTWVQTLGIPLVPNSSDTFHKSKLQVDINHYFKGRGGIFFICANKYTYLTLKQKNVTFTYVTHIYSKRKHKGELQRADCGGERHTIHINWGMPPWGAKPWVLHYNPKSHLEGRKHIQTPNFK